MLSSDLSCDATAIHFQWLVAPLPSRSKAQDLDSRTPNRLENTFGGYGHRTARHLSLNTPRSHLGTHTYTVA
jgi:hypothetical protein